MKTAAREKRRFEPCDHFIIYAAGSPIEYYTITDAKAGEEAIEQPGLIFSGKVVNLITGQSLPIYRVHNLGGQLPSINTKLGWNLFAAHPEVYRAKKLPDADSVQGKALTLEFPNLYSSFCKEAHT